MIAMWSKFKQTFDMLLCQINIVELFRLCNRIDPDSNHEAATPRSYPVIYNFTKCQWTYAQSNSSGMETMQSGEIFSWWNSQWLLLQTMRFFKKATYSHYYLVTARTTKGIPKRQIYCITWEDSGALAAGLPYCCCWAAPVEQQGIKDSNLQPFGHKTAAWNFCQPLLLILSLFVHCFYRCIYHTYSLPFTGTEIIIHSLPSEESW